MACLMPDFDVSTRLEGSPASPWDGRPDAPIRVRFTYSPAFVDTRGSDRMRIKGSTAVWLSLSLMAVACGMQSDPVTTTLSVTTSASVPTTSLPPTSAPPASTTPTTRVPVTIDWTDADTVTDLGDGWSVAACEGGATLLCVSRNGEEAGVVEALAYPLESFEGYDPAATPAETLPLIAGDFLESMEADRRAGCGQDYRFEEIPPEAFALGGLPGLSYGFAGALSDGSPSELNLQYSTVVEEYLVLVVAAAYDEGGCPGKDELLSFDSAELADFRPHLEQILAASPLPPAAPDG